MGDDKEDITILQIIERADYKTLQSLHKQYDKSTEEKFKFTCDDCGSENVSRASSIILEEQGIIKKDNTEVINNLKYKVKPSSRHFSLKEN